MAPSRSGREGGWGSGTSLQPLGWHINIHFMVMVVMHLMGQYVSTLNNEIGAETYSPRFNPLSLATFLACSSLYLTAFYRTWRPSLKALAALDGVSQRSHNTAATIFFASIILYWVPLFLLRGISGEDRVAWKADNSDLGVPFVSTIMLPIALAAALEKQRTELQKAIIGMAYLGIVLAIGERFTGLIMALPLLLTINVLRRSMFALVIIVALMLAVKLVLYYEISLADFELEVIFNIIAPRIANESGMLNTIFNEGKHWQILNYPLAIFPYQSWGWSDKPLVMSQTLTPGIYQIAYSTSGLVTGTFVDTLSFLFGPIIALAAAPILGYIGAKILFLGIALLKSNTKSVSFLGILVLIVLFIRFNPVIHSGMISSLIKVDTLLVTCIGAIICKARVARRASVSSLNSAKMVRVTPIVRGC